MSLVVVMRTMKRFLLWTVSSSSNEGYKTVSVLDTVSGFSKEDYKRVSVADTHSSSNEEY
jgi:hypothetical protein